MIRSIHGNGEGLTGGEVLKDRNNIGVWNDIVRVGLDIDQVGVEFTSSIVKKVGSGKNMTFWIDRWTRNRRLCDIFPRLFHLDRCKEAKVADRGTWDNGGWSWVWDWVREPRGRGCGDLEKMLGMLNDINLSHDCRDCWRWTLCQDGKFTIKALARLVDEKRLQSDHLGHATVWNSLAPKKVNVFVWRVLKGRLPVLTELDKRGIDLHTLLCPCCGNNVETINHSMLLCDMSWRVWEKVFNWWKFGCVDMITISELFRHNGIG